MLQCEQRVELCQNENLRHKCQDLLPSASNVNNNNLENLFYNVDGIINYGRHGSQFWTSSSGEYRGGAAPSLMKAETSTLHQC